MKIGYARVSSFEQNLDLQIQALKKEGCEEIFSDQFSGSKNIRQGPGFKKLMSRIRKGDMLIAWKLDRIGRSTIDVIKLIKDLSEQSIEVKTLSDHHIIDTSSPMGKFIFQISAAFAELELDFIKERTKAGLEAAKLRGNHPGRPKGLSEKTKKTARVAKSLFKSGYSKSYIAKELNIDRKTVSKYLNGDLSMK